MAPSKAKAGAKGKPSVKINAPSEHQEKGPGERERKGQGGGGGGFRFRFRARDPHSYHDGFPQTCGLCRRRCRFALSRDLDNGQLQHVGHQDLFEDGQAGPLRLLGLRSTLELQGWTEEASLSILFPKTVWTTSGLRARGISTRRSLRRRGGRKSSSSLELPSYSSTCRRLLP